MAPVNSQVVKGLLQKTPFFKEVFSKTAENIAPTAVSALLSAPYYYSAYDPLTASVATATDVGMSALLGSAAHVAVNRLRPQKMSVSVNPEYSDALSKLGTAPGASKNEILAAARNKLSDISSKYEGDLRKASPLRDKALPEFQAINNARNQLLSTNPKDLLVQTPQDSRLAGPASMAADIGFSMFGLPAALTAAENAGIIQNKLFQSPLNQQQSEIISQQLDSRSAIGLPNQSLLSPGTMHQLTGLESMSPESMVAALQQDLLRQAFEAKNSNPVESMYAQTYLNGMESY